MHASSHPDWIPREMLKGVESEDIESYMIAWEGWRRGLSLSWYSNSNILTDDFDILKRKFSLKSTQNNKTHYFYGSMGDKISYEAMKIINNNLFNDYLKKAGLTTQISNIRKKEHKYRVYVVGNEVVAVTKIIPANVIGDGKSSIKQLIIKKNKQRKENPYLANKLININNNLLKFIERQDFDLESIPQENERVFLNNTTDISHGADSININEDIPEIIKKTAIEGVKSIPGLTHGGVDIFYSDRETSITNIHANGDISIHTFPLLGESLNVPRFIVNYYFPETKDTINEQTKIYFDFKEVKEVLDKKFAKKISLLDAPIGELYTLRFIISGKVQKVGYRQFIRKKAIQNGLHGFAKNLKNGDVEVLVGGSSKDTIKEFKQICLKGSERSKVEEVKETNWEGFIKLGFEIK